jgi:cytochrome c553
MYRLILFLSILFLSLSATTKGLQLKTATGDQITMPYVKSYALLIGVSDYTNGWPDLESIPAELDQVKNVLESQGFHVEMVMNPKGYELSESYETFIDKYGYDPNNRLLFYYSGHGFTTNNGNKGYLVPADAPNPNIDLKGFKRKSLNMGKLIYIAREMENRHALFLFDSCFSGTIFKTRALPTTPPYIEQSMSKPVRQFITAGSANEEVPAKSTFTPMFIDAIKGKADLNRDKYVTGSELGMYLSQNLPNYSNQSPQYGKIKDYNLAQGDFVFLPQNTLPVPRTAPPPPPPKQSSFSFESVKPTLHALTVQTQPYGATVRFQNSSRSYHDGIRLEPGRYDIEVSKPGYYTKRGSVDLQSDLSIAINLERKAVQQQAQSYTMPAVSGGGKDLFRRCSACHGANGEKRALGKSQPIQGWSASKTFSALKGYQEGTYGGPMKGLMKGQVAKYDDAELSALAKYIESLR